MKKQNDTEENLLLLERKEKTFSRMIIVVSVIVGILITVLLTGLLSAIK